MSKINPNLAKLIGEIKSGAQVPAFSLINNIDTAAILSKYVSEVDNPRLYNERGDRRLLEPNYFDLLRVSNSKINDINDNEIALQMLPDLELSAQILVSSILSPKDMISTDLNYIAPKAVCPPTIAGKITKLIKEHFTTNYKIEAKLPLILRDILFRTGSYPMVVIPENALDEIINNNQRVAVEDHRRFFDYQTEGYQFKPRGLLGNPTDYQSKLSFESFNLRDVKPENIAVRISKEEIRTFNNNTSPSGDYDTSTYALINDNYDILSLPRLIKGLQETSVKKTIGLEGEKYLNDAAIDELLHRRMYYQSNTLVQVKTNDQGYRKSIGEPLCMRIPSEAVIPVYVPGDPSNHIGYFILIDENGNPLSKEERENIYGSLTNLTNSNRKCLTSTLLERGEEIYQGNDPVSLRNRYEHASRVYGEIIEKELVQRLRNGIYGKNFKIGNATEVYRVMFARALKQQFTQLLFVPSELMVYMAFAYDDNGVGKSLLDDMKIPNSLAISLMLANNRSTILNSIPRTKVSVKLDEDDPDSEARREQIAHEIMLKRGNGNNGIPVGVMNPVQIEQWASVANVDFEFTGSRDMPDMSIDVEDFQSNIPKADTDLEEEQRKRRTMGVGLSPETIDAFSGSNLATSVIQESILLARRVLVYQNKFEPHLTDYIIKTCTASPKIMGDIEEVLFNNFEEVLGFILPEKKSTSFTDDEKITIVKRVALAFVKQVSVELPKPNMISIKNKKEQYDEYLSAVETALDSYIGSELFDSEMYGELASKADAIKAALKAHFGRKWMVENDYLTELTDIVTIDDDGSPSFDLYEISADHSNALIKSFAKFMDKARPTKETGDLYMQSNDEEESTSDYSSDSSSDSSDSDSGSDDGFSDSDFGDDDFGFDSEF